jgi:hypothetical protein
VPGFRSIVRGIVVAAATAALVAGSLAGARAAAGGGISGTAFQDLNRNGAQDAGEAPFGGHQLYLYTAAGAYVTNATTDAEGRYTFSGVADGSYRVQYASPTWWGIRNEWLPTTSGSLLPRRTVSVGGGVAVADFGWRRITRSTDAASPMSVATTSNGIRVESFDDAVAAGDLATALQSGTLLGAEGPSITVRFDLGGGSSCSTGASQDGTGRYVSYAATVYVTYLSWLDGGDRTLFHELGHAWSQYFGYLVQQDPGFGGYLRARGVAGDDRVGSSYAWQPDEMIAEDFRQLFGSANASTGGQANTDLPTAANVAGLRDYLAGPFRSGTATPPPPSPAPLAVTGLAMSPTPVTTAGSASVAVSEGARVRLVVTDAKGGVVRVLADTTVDGASTVTAPWDRTNAAGRRVKNGTYGLRAEATTTDGRSAAATVSFRTA